MKNFATALMILLLAAGLVYAKDYTVMKKAGSYTVEVKLDKNPPVTGTNKMDIAIKDAAGKNVTNASVVVEYGMPAMPGMGAMNYKTNATLKGNSYFTTINFSMSGAWYVNIKINRGGKTQTVKLNVDIR
ncbi:hypothetical protein ASZ90_007861 [hydrocarbon metagenome]|uniref:YtkA-like domain-containing protein n=1 Tax=hydrocarbon metagenome TaxID=938273 RepID=A0A0W8FNM3_9ZZZZ